MFSLHFTLENFEYFLLILTRISMFVVVAPFFNMNNTPVRVKVGFSALVSLLLYFVIDFSALNYSTVIGYAFLVVREAVTGLIIGFSTYCCNFIILLAGNQIDMNVGLSMAQEYNPALRTETTVTGSLYNNFIMMFLVASGMHRYIFRSFCDAFELIPLGGTIFRWDSLFASTLEFMADVFIIAFRIVLPVFAVIMVLNAILGIMVKVAPQIHMFSVGAQLKIIVGFTVLFLTVFLLPDIAAFIFKEMKKLMVLYLQGLY
ncbi:flagellar biosynthetic protein FliR [Pseudobutyrivibrio sp. ACV-2]|uniref:flagellar biosynthetic protein FliR n=1 Tax=Pseudobutyrivibrio sp. ACV-2 TaxID=1520801 RepID=UPI000899466E|nr:flagellar biosynthetic protein FliR [Pseudobutyrivibrio sp. ACV-2]SDZ85540.1 flagellar biosynthetic protein FliR [Pseudobutyrivibrio sp. ACV-2]